MARLMVRMSTATGDAFESGAAPVSHGSSDRTDRPSHGRRRGGRGRGGRHRRGGGGEMRHEPEEQQARAVPADQDEPDRTVEHPAEGQSAPMPEAPEVSGPEAAAEASAVSSERLPGKPPGGPSAAGSPVAGEGRTQRTRPAAMEEALRRLQEVVLELREIIEDLEEAAELLDMAVEQKEEMNRELDRLNRLLNHLQRPREGQRGGGGGR